MNTPTRIVDAHIRLYDYRQNRHSFLDRADPAGCRNWVLR
jgi:hypothetical protein